MLEFRGLYIAMIATTVYSHVTNLSESDTNLLPNTSSTDNLVLNSNLSTTITLPSVVEASTLTNEQSSNLSASLSRTEDSASFKNELIEKDDEHLDVKTTDVVTVENDSSSKLAAFNYKTTVNPKHEAVSTVVTTLPHEILSSTDTPKQNSIVSSKVNESIEKNNNILLEMEEKRNYSIQHHDPLVLPDKPASCKGRDMLLDQPVNTGSSTLRKCCPIGESIYYGENGRTEYCDTSDKPFNPVIVDVTLYDNCIEDNERKVELEIDAGNPCNVSFIYSKANGDELFILQNGSLLVMDEFGNDSYEIQDAYCIDVDYKTGDLFAVVCVASVQPHLGRGQTILFAIFMISSIPCLFLVSFFHFAIRRLRTMHGLCLGFLSSCLAVGFLLHSIAQLSETSKSKMGYAVQYFMLAYFFWLLVLCCNIVVIVWYYLPRYIRLSRNARYMHFISYSLFALSIPLCIVLITRSKGLPGMPSYFFQAWSESIQSSQRYFIPPVTTILIFCFIFLIIAYFGFRKLDQLVENRSILRYRALNRTGKDDTGLPVIDLAMLEETKQDAKCITYLTIIILTTWIMEVITFYSPGSSDYLAFMEIINGLQGVFILIFFIGVRHRRNIIVRWWHDRGSLGITEVEMQNLNQNNA